MKDCCVRWCTPTFFGHLLFANGVKSLFVCLSGPLRLQLSEFLAGSRANSAYSAAEWHCDQVVSVEHFIRLHYALWLALYYELKMNFVPHNLASFCSFVWKFWLIDKCGNMMLFYNFFSFWTWCSSFITLLCSIQRTLFTNIRQQAQDAELSPLTCTSGLFRYGKRRWVVMMLKPVSRDTNLFAEDCEEDQWELSLTAVMSRCDAVMAKRITEHIDNNFVQLRWWLHWP